MITKIITFIITFYQTYLSFDKGVLVLLAPGGACKYETSCSQYTKQMIIKHGVRSGMSLGIKRIWSCR